jgi:hypothetical protein
VKVCSGFLASPGMAELRRGIVEDVAAACKKTHGSH